MVTDRTPEPRSRASRAGLALRWRSLDRAAKVELAWFVAGLGVYLVTRLFRITDFPAYFFCDEANQALHGRTLRTHLLQEYGVVLPTYFDQFGRFTLGTSVYVHTLGGAVFGMTAFGTRATSALVSVLVPLATALSLKAGFRVRYWWLAPWLAAVIPAWFVHSRTAFETTIWVAFYAATMCAYLLYRCRDPRYLYAVPPFFAAAFFAYQAAPLILAATSLCLALSDAAYHWRHRAIVWRAAVLFGVFVGIPYLRAVFTLPGTPGGRLRAEFAGVFWFQPIPLSTKLDVALELYLSGLSPQYWFSPAAPDLARHMVTGYGHLGLAILVPLVIGLVIAARQLGRPSSRVLLAMIAATPLAGAVVGLEITRLLSMIVPVILLSALGLDFLIARFARSNPPRGSSWTAAAVVILGGLSVQLMWDASVRLPKTWDAAVYREMQWGGPQLAARISELLKADPRTTYAIDPDWANVPEAIVTFYFPDDPRVRVEPLDDRWTAPDARIADKVSVITPDKRRRLESTGKFQLTKIDDLRYPTGDTAFEFVRVRPSPNALELIAAEQADLERLHEGTVTLEGEAVDVRFSTADMGSIGDVFDGKDETLLRGAGANPYRLELVFPAPRTLKGVRLLTNVGHWRRTIDVETLDGRVRFADDMKEPPADATEREIRFGPGSLPVRSLTIDLEALETGPRPHVHVYEVELVR